MFEDSIPVGLLRQHLFCPRIPFYTEVMGLRPEWPPWVDQGLDYHHKERKRARERLERRFGRTKPDWRRDVSIKSVKWSLHGRLDGAAITAAAVYPVEFKLRWQPAKKAHRVQITAYALLAEEYWNRPAPAGFVLGAQRKIRRISVDEEAREEVLKERDQLVGTLNSTRKPETPAAESQCAQCEFFNFCNDRS
ncbi:MAG: CRISPR-associated protein Cas4 [Thiohalorhabdus sp.]|uniref:CRISPR-associated protein Cas4 n=1 Tax=Thiohalorhabdus sp. TaxID=3094134 RepID=UPI00398005A3